MRNDESIAFEFTEGRPGTARAVFCRRRPGVVLRVEFAWVVLDIANSR